MKNEVIIRTGRGSFKFDAIDNAFSQTLANALFENVGRKVPEATVHKHLLALKTRLEKAMRVSAAKIIPHIINRLIGLDSKGSSLRGGGMTLTSSFFGEGPASGSLVGPVLKGVFANNPAKGVFWPSLKLSTIRKKTDNKSKFFLETGDLRANILGNDFNLTKLLSESSVKFTRESRSVVRSAGRGMVSMKIPIGRITIRIAPRLNSATLPALRTGDWTTSDPNLPLEKRIHISPKNREKLEGPQIPKPVHRPLLQPAVAFWLFFQVPHLMKQALSAAITKGVRT